MIDYLTHSLAWSAAWFTAGYLFAQLLAEWRRHNKSGGNR